MKKSICIAVLVGMMLSMNACGEKKNETINPIQTEQSAVNDSSIQTNNGNKNEGKQDYEKIDYLTDTYREPRYKATIDGPNLIRFSEAPSQLWNADSQYFIIMGIYNDVWDQVDREAIKTVEDIVPNLKEYILLSSKDKAYVTEVKDIVITDQKRVTINGRETNRFEGYYDCPSSDGTISNRYIMGYSLFYKDQPMYLMGIVSSNDQEQKYKDTVTKTVDDMIKTLRDGAVAK